MKRSWDLSEEQETRKRLFQDARKGKRAAREALMAEFGARVYSPAERARIDVAKLLADLSDKLDDLPAHQH